MDSTMWLFTPTSPARFKARDLLFMPCSKRMAVSLVQQWHSRLPRVQAGPWQFAFCGSYDGSPWIVALWNNPSARTLPHHWLELRRMAGAPGLPPNSCSRFLGWMERYFKEYYPERERLISYQDTAVHKGTIYKAANWSIGAVSKARMRDRSKSRIGTTRNYRSDLNGVFIAASEKIRWERALE